MWPKYIPLPSTIILSAGLGFLGLGYAMRPESNVMRPLSQNPQLLPEFAASKLPLVRTNKPEAYYMEITERPIFSTDRRPNPISQPTLSVSVTDEVVEPPIIVEIALEPEPEPVVLIDFILLGTMLLNGNSIALISVDGASPEWVKQNTLIFGWTLREITPENVTLYNGLEVIRLFLYEEDK